jgi:hypothetical protein
MRFAITQELPGAADVVIATLLDPAFLAGLGELPNLAPPTVLDQTRSGDVVVQRVHYRFVGSLSSAVTRVIDPAKVSWVDEVTYDLADRRATFRIIPDHYGDKLRCHGTYTFEEQTASTVRRVEGELSVRVPLVGRMVERAIVGGLTEHIETEASLLTEWLDARRGRRHAPPTAGSQRLIFGANGATTGT